MATETSGPGDPTAIRQLPSYLLFWTYNTLWAVFDGYVVWTIAQFFGWHFIYDAPDLGVPAKIWVLFGAICIVPVLVMIKAAFLGRAERPARLLRLLYGVEVPIQGLLFLALLFLRQATPVVWLLAVGAGVAVFGLIGLATEGSRTRPVAREWALLLSQTVGLLLVSYVLALSVLFLPIGYGIAASSLSFPSLFEILQGFAFPPVWVVPFSVANGVISPFAATVVYLRSFRRQFAAVANRVGTGQTAAVVAAFGTAFVAAGIVLGWQPTQARLRATVERFREARSFEERQAAARDLEPRLPALRRYLVGVYLAPYRYVLDEETLLRPHSPMWNGFAPQVHGAIKQLAAPFVYRGCFQEDAQWAAEAYKDLFNEGIQNGEHEAIETTLRDSFTRDGLAAGLLDRYRRRVQVVSQEVRVEWDGSSAVVMITEEYENKTDEPQEALYEFSLPESAAVTGLWLGPDLEFEGVLAPRGAARQVYEAEVERKKDPALLEQTGPRQYRLRVFPIPRAAAATADSAGRQTKLLRAAFRYVVLPNIEQDSLTISLPRLNESRNVFWDDSFEARLTGPAASVRAGSTEHWSNGSVLRLTAAPTPFSSPMVLRVGDTAVTLGTETHEMSSRETATETARRIAVLLDASHASAGWDWKHWLRKDAAFGELVRNHRLDAYFFSDALSAPIPLADTEDERLAGVLPLGRARTLEALETLCDAGYDSILVLSVGGGVGDGSVLSSPCAGPPVAIAHVDGRVPAYADALSARALQGCGVHDTVASALRCLLALPPSVGTRRAFLTATHTLELSAGQDLPTRLEACPSSRPVCQVLAHKVALAMIVRSDLEPTGFAGFASMTELHELALLYHVLTPSSSLIALVADSQRQDLAEASEGEAAFAAPGVGTEEELEAPSGQGLLNVQGVPEPETWILLSVVGVMLGLFVWWQRAA